MIGCIEIRRVCSGAMNARECKYAVVLTNTLIVVTMN